MKSQKINLSDIKNSLSGSCSLFICSSSFEERCLSVPNNIDRHAVSKTLIFSNDDLREHIELNKSKLIALFGDKGKPIELSTVDPLISADNISESLKTAFEEGYCNDVLIDVSTFTHESLMMLLKLFQIITPESNIIGIYANAAEYCSGDDVRHKWLSRGFGDVRTVLGYAGNIDPSLKTHLIIIVGYEHERAAGIIETLEPHSISLGYGRSEDATTDKNKDANEHYMHLVEQVASSYADVELFEVKCNNPQETKYIIEEQIRKADRMNVLIAPMNNKLTTIGATWAALKYDTVQMCYIQALRYNYLNYSTPGNQCYIFDLSNKSLSM